jgi:cell division protein FtsI/penicillin-binding protein 2
VADAFAPSASLFKLVTASALLEGAKVTPLTRECFDGGEHELRPADLDRRGSTCSTVGEALGHSYNVVFARLAKRHLAPAELRRFAAALGFSGEVPIDVPVEGSVVHIPDDPFGMARASAGFWNGRLVPLGGVFAMQTIANDGERIRLSLVDAASGRVSSGRAVASSTARALTQMLEVTTRRGTAAKAFHRPDGSPYLPQIAVAAKTGTLVGGSPSRMYSWFAAFAPSTKPEIAVCVMLGNDLHWRTKANIVGRDVLGAYFNVPSSPGLRIAARLGGRARRR